MRISSFFLVFILTVVTSSSNSNDDSGSAINMTVALKTAKARLYTDRNFRGVSEAFNAEENSGVGCHNLNSKLAGNVQSIDSFGTCVQLFSQQNCIGRRFLIYPLSSGKNTNVNAIYKDLSRFSLTVLSISPCFPQPGKKDKFPDELLNATIQNGRAIGVTQELIEKLEEEVSSLREEVERLEFRALGTTYSKSGPEKWRKDACGGFIDLHAGAELAYQNSGKTTQGNNSAINGTETEELEEEWCTWVISSVKTGSFTVQVREMKGPKDSSTGTISIHYGFSGNEPTSYKAITLDTDKKDPIKISSSVALLLFGSTKGQGFKLRIMDATQGHSSQSRFDSNSFVTVNFLDGSTETTNSSLPSVNSTSNPPPQMVFTHPALFGQHYSSYERRHVIIPPIPGKRIHLVVNFLDTEEDTDYLNIFRFSRDDREFKFMGSLTGGLGHFDNGTFIGGENEMMVAYFHSDFHTEYLGFEILYSYFPANDNSFLSALSLQKRKPQRPFSSCGGLVLLSNYSEINYERNLNSGGNKEETCIFIVSATFGGPIAFTLMEHSFTSNGKNASLTVHLMELHQSMTTITMSSETEGGEAKKDVTLLYVVFQSTEPGQKFRLKIRDLHQKTWRIQASNLHNVKYIGWEKDEEIFQLFNSTNSSSLSNKAWTDRQKEAGQSIFILQAALSKRIELSVDFVQTETNKEFLSVLKFSKGQNKFQFYGRFSGPIGRIADSNATNAIYETGVDEPILLYFETKNYELKGKFQLSYSYQNETSSTVTPDNGSNPFRSQLDSTVDPTDGQTEKVGPQTEIFDQCGGVIVLDTEKDLTFPKFMNQTHQSGLVSGMPCIFLFQAPNEGIIGLKLVTGQLGQGSIAIRIIEGDFAQNTNISSAVTSILDEEDLKEEIVHEGQSLFLCITFHDTSLQTEGLRLHLRELGMVKIVDEYRNVDYKILSPLNMTIHQMEPDSNSTFIYPSAPERKYGKAQRHYFLLAPASQQNLSLAMNFVELNHVLDFIHIYRFEEAENNFQFVQRLVGCPGELYMKPMVERGILLIFIQTDPYSVDGQGFGITAFSSKERVTSKGQSADSHHQSAPCGAMVQLTQEVMELYYQNPFNRSLIQHENLLDEVDSSEETCAFILSPSKGGPLSLTLTSMGQSSDDNSILTNFSAPILTLQTGFNDNDSTVFYFTAGDLNKEIVVNDSTSTLLIFKSIQGQQFSMTLREMDQGIGSVIPVRSTVLNFFPTAIYNDSISSDDSIFPTVLWSGNPNLYRKHELTNILINGQPGFTLRLTMISTIFYESLDYIHLLKYARDEGQFLIVKRYDDKTEQSKLSEEAIVGEDGEPLFLFASTNYHRDSFKFSYVYEVPMMSNGSDLEIPFFTNEVSVSNEFVEKVTDSPTQGARESWSQTLATFKEEMRGKYEASRVTSKWLMGLLIFLCIMSTIGCLGFYGVRCRRGHFERLGEHKFVKKTIGFVRTGTRESVLLEEDTVI